MKDKPIYLARRMEWPGISRAVLLDDGVHFIEHNGDVRPSPAYSSVEEMNNELKRLGFPEFSVEN